MPDRRTFRHQSLKAKAQTRITGDSAREQSEIERMLPRHFKILDLSLGGMMIKDIADIVGMTRHGVGLIVNSPRFQDEIARRRDSQRKTDDEELATGTIRAREMIDQASVDAAEVHIGLLGSKSERVKQLSANAILNLAFDKSGTSEGARGTIILNAEKIELLQIALRESRDGRQSTGINGDSSDEAPRERQGLTATASA